MQKMTILEVYKNKHYLDYGNRKFSAESRVEAGQRLFNDWYYGHRVYGAIDYERVKVDTSIKTDSVAMLKARDRFNKAFKAIPAEFRGVVYRVVIENKPLYEDMELSRWERKIEKAASARFLVCGLDRLLGWYNRRNK